MFREYSHTLDPHVMEGFSNFVGGFCLTSVSLTTLDWEGLGCHWAYVFKLVIGLVFISYLVYNWFEL